MLCCVFYESSLDYKIISEHGTFNYTGGQHARCIAICAYD